MASLKPTFENTCFVTIANPAEQMTANVRVDKDLIRVVLLPRGQEIIPMRIELFQLRWRARVRFSPVRSARVMAHERFELGEELTVPNGTIVGTVLNDTNVARLTTLRVAEPDTVCVGEADFDGKVDTIAVRVGGFLVEPIAHSTDSGCGTVEGDRPFVGILWEEAVHVEDTIGTANFRPDWVRGGEGMRSGRIAWESTKASGGNAVLQE